MALLPRQAGDSPVMERWPPWHRMLSGGAAVALLGAGIVVMGGIASAATTPIAEYTVPSSFSGPEQIAAGPDGNLWFTEQSGNNVGKVSTSGAFTEYPVPDAGADPQGIVAGPDGNLWFTEYSSNMVTKVTTSGAFTQYPLPLVGNATTLPQAITVGPDGNLWFTEYSGNNVGKITPAGAITLFPIPTATSHPTSIASGPDHNLWLTEQTGNKVAKLTTSGVFTEYTLPTVGGNPTGIAAGPDGNLWFTENGANKVAKTSISGTITEFTIPTAASAPSAITSGPDGNLWVTEMAGNNVARVTIAGVITEFFIPTANSMPAGIAAGPDGNLWFTEYGAVKIGEVALGTTCPGSASVGATSTNQYSLANSNGATWQEMDATKLRIACTAISNQALLLTANADLFTNTAGYNQDLGLFVSDDGGADQLLAWKESGGLAGVYSPNAAYVQYFYTMTFGHHYVFKLEWKTNRNAAGATIYAGAGSGTFSPTSLIAQGYLAGAASGFVVSTAQYKLANSDGVSWQNIDPAHLSVTLAPSSNSTAVLGANADLFTAKSGYNQDLGIFVSDNGSADVLVAWKESGGAAGVFSPNAAFVKATYVMTASHSYTFKLKWKTNRNAAGATIYAGAGSGPYSPTSLIAQILTVGTNLNAVSTRQYTLTNSDGATWQPIDAALNVSVTPGIDEGSIVGANADLWTASAGLNQDIGIFVSDNGAADVLVAWKESGGLAGTYSPNAAFAQAEFQMTSGHTYVFKLKWKTNKSAPGGTIHAAAGGSPPYSPTRLIVELTQ